MPRRRSVSEHEAARRKKQRETPRPSYAALNSEPSLSQVREVAEPSSAGARSELLNPRPPPAIPTLLYTRRQAAEMLNCSVASLIRMENSGQLRAIKLNKQKRSAATYYAASDLQLLVIAR
jgi:hypothetical protein